MGDSSENSIVPRPLGTITLIWLLICMGALTIPQPAWINDEAILVGLALGLCLWLDDAKVEGDAACQQATATQ